MFMWRERLVCVGINCVGVWAILSGKTPPENVNLLVAFLGILTLATILVYISGVLAGYDKR
jgi:hypothetical protein